MQLHLHLPAPPRCCSAVVSTLLSLMDGLTDRGSVIVIGATNRWVWGACVRIPSLQLGCELASPAAYCARPTAAPLLPPTCLPGWLPCRPEAIDPALRRPGRLDREVRPPHYPAVLPRRATPLCPTAVGAIGQNGWTHPCCVLAAS